MVVSRNCCIFAVSNETNRVLNVLTIKKIKREMEEIAYSTSEVEVNNRNYSMWVDGLPLVTTIERNNQYLHITREDCFGKPHSMQRDGNKTTYYIHGVEVPKRIWKDYIKIWKKL